MSDNVRSEVRRRNRTRSVVDTAPPKAVSRRLGGKKWLLFAGAVLLAVIVTEASLRLFFSARFSQAGEEQRLLYRYHPTLGWFPQTNSTRKFTGSRQVTVTHNSRGFRDKEPTFDNKPGLLILGDSFVWGFDVEASERFTDKLRARHPQWNIYNLGVSGYSTDQELLLLESVFDEYKPRAVILVFCSDNDFDDNAYNVNRSGDYKPYFVVTAANEIALQGVPVPKSERLFLAEHGLLSHSYTFRLLTRVYFRRQQLQNHQVLRNPTDIILMAARTYVAEKGAFFGVAIQEGSPDEELKKLLTNQQIPWVALNTTNRYPESGGHWTPKGHDDVCEKLDRFLGMALNDWK